MTLAAALVLLDVSVRAMLVAGAVFLLIRWTGVPSPHTRHSLWLGVLLAMLAMPGLRPIVPDLPVPVSSWFTSYASLPDTTSSTGWTTEWTVGEATADASSAALPGTRQVATAEASNPWTTVPIAIYLGGLLLFGGRVLHGALGARRVVRGGRPVRDARAASTGYPVLESAAVLTPLTVGVVRPRIVLPAAWPTWTRAEMAAVLAHEAAHARRRDPLVAVLAQVNCAIFWFHPVAWWLRRTLSSTAEEICDAAGVEAIGQRQQYAELLLSFARVVQQRGRVVWQGSGVTGRGSLADRIERVLRGEDTPRVSRHRNTAVAACAATVVCLAAAMEARSVPQPSPGALVEPAFERGVGAVREGDTASRSAAAGAALASVVGRPPRAAQAGMGSIQGVVLDSSGLPIPDAQVTLGEPPTEITERTDDLGRYAFYNMTTGTYQLRVQVPGFKTLTRRGVAVTPGPQTLDPAMLQIGGLTETVTIPRDAAVAAQSLAHPGPAAAPSAAESLLLAAVAAAPDQPQPYLDLARFYADAGRQDDQGRLARRAHELARRRQAQASGTGSRTGGEVMPPLAVRHPAPVFPATVPGKPIVVILEATIGVDGAMRGVRVLRGLPPFDAAALSALEQWLYTPALLNGKPIEVTATVVMNFTSE